MASIPVRPQTDTPKTAVRGDLLKLALGAVMISFSGVWVKTALVPPMVSAFYRVCFGGVFLLMYAAWRKEIHKSATPWLAYGLAGGLFFALDLYFWHMSIRYVGPGLATILTNFQVFLLSAYGVIFLGERLGIRFILAVPLALLGLWLVVGLEWHQLSSAYKIGVFFGFAAAASYTGFLLTLRRLQSVQSPHSRCFALLIVSLASAGLLGGAVGVGADTFRIPNWQSGVSLLALGLFSQTIGWLLITASLPKVRPSTAGLMLLLQPALAFVWDVLFFDRLTSWSNWIGVSITLLAVNLGMGRPTSASGRNPDSQPDKS